MADDQRSREEGNGAYLRVRILEGRMEALEASTQRQYDAIVKRLDSIESNMVYNRELAPFRYAMWLLGIAFVAGLGALLTALLGG